MTKPMLVAFDFDHTIADDNSDIVVRKLLPSAKINDIKHLYRSDGWTAYMQKIFNLLHTNGYTREEITSAVNKIPFTPGLDSVLHYLKENNCDAIIISDSNSVFIQDWLHSNGFAHAVHSVFTNPASYNSEGGLDIDMYHVQDWCKLSTVNLCKGHILENFISEKVASGVSYSKVAYVGDGKNDYCPILRLSSNDLAFPREGYALIDILTKNELLTDNPVKASVHPWKSGIDILDVIKMNI